MKNQKLVLGAIATVVVVGLAIGFGGNYFQGSLSNLSTISKTPTVSRTVNIQDIAMPAVPVVTKQPLASGVLNSATLNLANLSIESSNNKTLKLNQLRFDISSTGLTSLGQCKLYNGSTLVSNATTASTSEVNFDNFSLTVDSKKSLSVNCDVVVNKQAFQNSLGTSLSSVSDSISWSVDGTAVTGKGADIVKATMTWSLT